VTCLVWFLLGAYPLLLIWVYVVLYLVMYALRLFLYAQIHFACFMIDVCYWGNFALVAYIFIAPDSADLFQAIFGFVHGPVLWAIWSFEIKLHPTSLDKFISLFVHVMPAVVCFVMMWHQPPATDIEVTFMLDRSYTVCRDKDCSLNLVALWVWPCLSLMALCAGLSTCQIMPELFGCGNQMTAYKWLTRNDKHVIVRCTQKLGCTGWRSTAVQYCTGYLMTLLFLFPAPLAYMNQYVHGIYILVFFCLALWNGGMFLEKQAHKDIARKRELGQSQVSNPSNP